NKRYLSCHARTQIGKDNERHRDAFPLEIEYFLLNPIVEEPKIALLEIASNNSFVVEDEHGQLHELNIRNDAHPCPLLCFCEGCIFRKGKRNENDIQCRCPA